MKKITAMILVVLFLLPCIVHGEEIKTYSGNDNFVFPSNPSYFSPELTYKLSNGTYCVDMPLNYNYEITEEKPFPTNTQKIKITGI